MKQRKSLLGFLDKGQGRNSFFCMKKHLKANNKCFRELKKTYESAIMKHRKSLLGFLDK
jgi:hypothetical protein